MGGGSVIDTAKAANLYATFSTPDFYAYVNPPLGQGLPVPSSGTQLPPLIAIPTTAGTGSETTGVAIFDDTATKSKTGIASRAIKPTLGVLDVHNTQTLPPLVAAYSGLDVLCHALESYTALPFNMRQTVPSAPPHLRPAYQGSNPISDVWAMYALETCCKWLPIALQKEHEQHDFARSQMLLAATSAGTGFGNAGVHLCHGMSYPISSQVKSSYKPGEGYMTDDHAMIPHGLSVIVNAPSVFAFTGSANPGKHAKCARILQQARMERRRRQNNSSIDNTATLLSSTTNMDVATASSPDAGMWLADEIRYFLQDLNAILDGVDENDSSSAAVVGIPLGLTSFGYSTSDISSLVEGTLPQHRVTKLSPRPVGREELEQLFEAAMNDSL